MSNDDVIPFQKPRPQQLTRREVEAMYKAGQTDEVERARVGGFLASVMAGIPDAKILEDRAAHEVPK